MDDSYSPCERIGEADSYDDLVETLDILDILNALNKLKQSTAYGSEPTSACPPDNNSFEGELRSQQVQPQKGQNMANLPMHSEPDAVLNVIGDLHMGDGEDAGLLLVGDVNLMKKFAAAAGVLNGGRQFGHVRIVFTKITADVVTSDQTFGNAFSEPSEPVE